MGGSRRGSANELRSRRYSQVGGSQMTKPDIGAIADVLSDVLELIETLRDDVIIMMEELES